MIKILKHAVISEIGKRANNEDNFSLIEGSTYVVCDGVGGSEKGEIASEITSNNFAAAFNKNPHCNIDSVLIDIEAKLTSYADENPDSFGMATTLTFSHVREDGIYVGWVGDSRIYQFRNGQIVFKSTDHSWVNDALKAGIITAEEAINHPKSNIITRAVQGSHKPTKADSLLLTDIQMGDLFMQCSDGVLETWTDDDLKALFASIDEPQEILDRIKIECEQHSKDNFTAIVYRIQEATFVKKNVSAENYVESIPVFKKEQYKTNPTAKGILKLKILGVPMIAWLVVFISLILFLKLLNPTENESPKKPKMETDGGKKKGKAKSLIIKSKEIHKLLIDSLINDGYSLKKPVTINDQINKKLRELKTPDSLKNRSNEDWKKLKLNLNSQIEELKSKTEVQYDSLIIPNSGIIYYKKK